jgi:hypothetical protein
MRSWLLYEFVNTDYAVSARNCIYIGWVIANREKSPLEILWKIGAKF